MSKLKIISSKIVFDHPWLKVFEEKVKDNHDNEYSYLLSKPNDFVVIVAFATDKSVILLEQYKHGAQENLLGFPAGYINKAESPLSAAKRELFEETGFKAQHMKLVVKLYENPTIGRSCFYLFFAEGIKFEAKNIVNKDILEGDVIQKKVLIKELLNNENLSRIKAAPMLSSLPFIFMKIK